MRIFERWECKYNNDIWYMCIFGYQKSVYTKIINKKEYELIGELQKENNENKIKFFCEKLLTD